MSALIDRLRAASLDARRTASPLTGLYSAVLGALDTRAKAQAGVVLGDQDAIAVLQSFAKGIDETIQALSQRAPSGAALDKAHLERAAITALLPQKMAAADLRAYLEHLRATGTTNLGAAMARLKADRFGTYDGKEAAALAKEVFAA